MDTLRTRSATEWKSLLAERTLLSAYAKQLRPVPVALVEEKAKDMAEAQGTDPSELESDSLET